MRTGFLVPLALLAAFVLTGSSSTAQALGIFPLAPPVHRESGDWVFRLPYWHADTSLSSVENRVVFIGDSITTGWELQPLFSLHPEFTGRGVGGQTAQQMLARFQIDVIKLKPVVVHIMGGTNDVAGNNGPESDETIEEALGSMVNLAVANNIRVVLATIPPTKKFGWRPGLEPAARIKKLNAWLVAYAASHHVTLVDYWTALAEPSGGMKSEYSSDGVHPNAAGYAAMDPLLKEALRKVEPKP